MATLIEIWLILSVLVMARMVSFQNEAAAS
jgi:hypothetical protein